VEGRCGLAQTMSVVVESHSGRSVVRQTPRALRFRTNSARCHQNLMLAGGYSIAGTWLLTCISVRVLIRKVAVRYVAHVRAEYECI
jgi:hypothetical protein